VIDAVSEADARGETAALFAEIRHALGVPVVNLVWRHLATLPGALPWAWATVAPAYRSGAAAREGAALLAALARPALPRWSRDELRAAAVDAEAERTIVTVLDSYNRSNAMNLVALTALRLALDGPRALRPAGGTPGVVGPPPVTGPLPEPLPVARMTPAVAALVAELDRLGARGPVQIPATMYRHLAHWPGFLALMRERLAPLHGDGRLGRLVDDAAGLAEEGAARLTLAARSDRPPTRAAVHAALTAFTSGVIATMVPVCAVVRHAMPGGDERLAQTEWAGRGAR
jgi:hypothetical protein